jgi:hypothetical protein
LTSFAPRWTENLYRDDGSIKKESIAQIVNDQNFVRIKNLFEEALAKGAKVAVGGTLEQADRTIHPTLLTDVTPDMQIMREEIFAPIVPVVTYTNIDEVIGHISAGAKPLALYIYSNDQNNIEKVLTRTSSGGRDDQRILLALPGKPVAVRRRESKRHGQLSRVFRVQNVLSRARHLHSADSVDAIRNDWRFQCDLS